MSPATDLDALIASLDKRARERAERAASTRRAGGMDPAGIVARAASRRVRRELGVELDPPPVDTTRGMV